MIGYIRYQPILPSEEKISSITLIINLNWRIKLFGGFFHTKLFEELRQFINTIGINVINSQLHQ
jgi:hypothetical protein